MISDFWFLINDKWFMINDKWIIMNYWGGRQCCFGGSYSRREERAQKIFINVETSSWFPLTMHNTKLWKCWDRLVRYVCCVRRPVLLLPSVFKLFPTLFSPYYLPILLSNHIIHDGSSLTILYNTFTFCTSWIPVPVLSHKHRVGECFCGRMDHVGWWSLRGYEWWEARHVHSFDPHIIIAAL